MRGPVYLSVAVAVAVALPSAASAQQVRAGAEFQANTYTPNIQRRPDVLIRHNGDFIVAWTGRNPLDASEYGAFGQRYDVTGAPQGGEFRINTYTTSFQFRPVMAGDAKGNFVVVWSSLTQDGDYYGVFGQRYDAAGAPRGAEFQVNTYITGGQGASFYFVEHNQGVSMTPSGNFVVVWGSYYADQDGDGGSVHGQRYDASGNRVGGEFQINTYTTGYQFSPSVAMNADNSFVVVWSTEDGSGYGVAGRRYDTAGNPIGAEFQVPSATTGHQRAAFVRARDNGDFTVTWSDGPIPVPPAPTEAEVFARRFNANGTPAGAQFQVNTTVANVEYSYSWGMDRRGNFAVNWNNRDDGSGVGVGGRRFRNDGAPREPESGVNLFITATQNEQAATADEFGNVLSAWVDGARDGGGEGVFVQRFGGLRPTALAVDTAGNRVIEPGETVSVSPAWRNVNGADQTFGGVLSDMTGPPGATYIITDTTASYGTVANNATGTCTADCYGVSVSNPPTRPVLHWDAAAVETITPDTQGQVKSWTLHVGNSFTDVPTNNPFYRFVETLLHHGITAGCTPTAYCPAAATSREQMAVFILVGKEGLGYAPPACTTPVFLDVPASSPFCRWIEELFRRGVVTGCGGGNYCPTANVSREQMPVFVLRTLDPTLDPPPCVPPNLFDDVPETSPFCRWIEQLARNGVVTGCGGGGNNYCPLDPVTREQMGVFISVTFGLALYGL